MARHEEALSRRAEAQARTGECLDQVAVACCHLCGQDPQRRQGDLPVERPMAFRLVVILTTAKVLI
ncbi:MAG TPA: hypothetical protein VIH59_31430 [Candidatus Tectomicrobia bacterium]|jgi:hypothetical protein